MLIKRRNLLSGAAALAAYGALRPPAEAQTCGTFYPAAPTPASNAGYSRLVFCDDFNVSGTIASTTNPGPSSGYNWYLAPNATSANAVVNTTGTAAGISNGNTGGGLFPSGNGGILSLNGPNVPGNGNVTIYSTPLSTQKVSNPGFGCWGPNVYIEVYAQFNPNYTANNQWYAPLWHFTQVYESIGGNQCGQEIDVIENFCGNFSYPDNQGPFSGHQWQSNGTEISSGGGAYGTGLGASWTQTNMDANWHAYGWLWTSTGSGTGNIQVFFDNQPAVLYNNGGGAPYSSSVLAVGTGGTTGFQYLTGASPVYAIMGGPPGINMNIDYYRVWSA